MGVKLNRRGKRLFVVILVVLAIFFIMKSSDNKIAEINIKVNDKESIEITYSVYKALNQPGFHYLRMDLNYTNNNIKKICFNWKVTSTDYQINEKLEIAHIELTIIDGLETFSNTYCLINQEPRLLLLDGEKDSTYYVVIDDQRVKAAFEHCTRLLNSDSLSIEDKKLIIKMAKKGFDAFK